MLLDDLLSRRLILLSGKGGVGKSVVGAALALAARDRGRRVLLLDVDAPLPASRYLDALPGGSKEAEALPGLFTANLKPQEVMDEYVRRHVRVELIVRRIVESPVYHRFFAAAPGLKELMILGKIVVLSEERAGWPRRPRYDLVIADLPATGHGLTLLKVPLAASAAIPVGPIGHQARWILKKLRDPEWTALLVVAVPEEMAVVEAMELRQAASADVGVIPQGVVLNACHERLFSRLEEASVLRLSRQGAAGRLRGGVPLSSALLAARRQLRRARLTRFYERRLRSALTAPIVRLPFLYEERLGLEAVRRLAARLAEA
jgi:anion-transporting  ArsA/GET3 family ATPase